MKCYPQEFTTTLPDGTSETFNLSPGYVQYHLCNPVDRLEDIRETFLTLVVVNQLVFLLAIFLKYRRPWKKRSLLIAGAVCCLSFFASLSKIALVIFAMFKQQFYACDQGNEFAGGLCTDKATEYDFGNLTGTNCVGDCILAIPTCAGNVRYNAVCKGGKRVYE